MKAKKDWTYRTTTTLVEYKAGDEIHEFAMEAAIAAGVVEQGNESAKGSKAKNTLHLKG